MTILMRSMALLAKLETVYGTDPIPTGAANAMLVRNVRVDPLNVVSESRELARPYLGNSEDIVGAFYGGLQFEVEAAGAGAAGAVPKYGPLMRACGLAEVISAGVKVTYTPVSTAFESITLYVDLDGVEHKFTGGRGSVAFKGNNRSATSWVFNFMGLFKPVIDAPLPVPNYTGFVKPLAFNTANTPTFTLHAAPVVLRNLSLDLANSLNYRNLINSEAVQILDRKPVGAAEFEATLMATKNWFTAAKDSATGLLHLVHGVTAGNIIEINAPSTQVTEPKYSDFDGAAMLQTNLKLQPTTAGNDELEIIIR